MKLTDLLPFLSSKLGYGNEVQISTSNVDDFFKAIKSLGIKQIEVDQDQMSHIVSFYLYCVGNDKNGNQAEVIREGKIDKFWGIDLILVV